MTDPLPKRAPRATKPAAHPYRKTLTPGSTWCIHPIAKDKTCGQPENHPLHQPTQKAR